MLCPMKQSSGWWLALALVGCDPELEAGEPRFTVDGAASDADSSRDGGGRDRGQPIDFLVDLGEVPGDASRDAVAQDAAVEDAATHDAAPGDAALDAEPPPDAAPDMADPPDPPAEGPARYLAGRLHSPLTPWVRDQLRAIRARDPARQDDVFAKIGDSITVSGSFLECFAGANVQLAGRDFLGDTINFFLGGDAAGGNPYTRESLAATVGWSAISALRGDPSPIDRELAALDPRFAVVMFGTNDIQRNNITAYADEMLDIVDLLLSQGVIPLLSSIPPRGDSAAADAQVPAYNAIVRGIAEGRQVPFVDLEMALRPLPNYGLAGDRLHGSTYQSGGRYLPCAFTEAGLQHGYNWRNLLTIEALHRVVGSVLGEVAPPDAPSPPRVGTGTPEDPLVIDALPYTHLADTREAPSDAFDAYPGCNAPQNEGGPEYVYRLDLDRPTTVRAMVFDRGTVDIDIHLLGGPDPARCLDRDHNGFEASLEAGTWYFALDTFMGADGQPDAGEFLFVLVQDP